ncbi:MAG: methyltransferase domain-containing protein, partial [Planctomycetes bacterium]|nr:methyltransferase domain-containing protein [Planctomycetota bacterium]
MKPTVINRNLYGVFPSFAVISGIELEVFTFLKGASLSAAALAARMAVREDKLTPLLYLLVVAGVLNVEDGVFSNTDEAEQFLVKGSPDYMGDSSGFYKSIWEMSLKTAESIRTGSPQAKLDFHNLPDEQLDEYFRRQFPHSLGGGQELAEKLDFSRYSSLLDAGGGTGGVSIAICRTFPNISATVADLPNVVKMAEQFIAESGLSGRVGVSPVDLRRETPTGRYDVAVLRAVLQTLSRADAHATLNHVGQAMAPGADLYIIGTVMENSHVGPPISLAYSMVFLNSYDDGQAYTEEEYHNMLDAAGFIGIGFDYERLGGMCLV